MRALLLLCLITLLLAACGGAATPRASESDDVRQMLSENRLEEAETALQTTLARDADNVDALINLGALRYQQGELAEAIELFERARTLAPTDADLLYNLGSAYAQQRNFDRAIVLYNEAIAQNNALPMPYFGLGTVYHAQGKATEATEALNRFLAISQDADLRQRAQQMLADLQAE